MRKTSWKSCLKATEKKFKYAIGHIYVNEIQAEGKNVNDILQVNKMINKIKESLVDLIKQSPWMDDITKAKAIYKSNLIKPMVGFSETVNNKVIANGTENILCQPDNCFVEKAQQIV